MNNVHPVKYKNNCLNPRLCNYGRRVSYREMNGTTQVAHTVFLYNGYLCIQQLFSNSPWNVYKEFIWDPTEPVATRPLAFRQYCKTATFLMHDGNKNVTDVVTVGPANAPVAHYDYAPFGAATATGTHSVRLAPGLHTLHYTTPSASATTRLQILP